MDTFTIAAAARLCHCDRRTLQRAIHAGRLHLDAQHCLSREALLAAGYLVIDTPHEAPQITPQAAPHDMPQRVPQYTPHSTPLVVPQDTLLLSLLERLTTAIAELAQEVRQLRTERPHAPLAVPHGTPHGTPQRAPQEAPPTDVDHAYTRMQTLQAHGLTLAQIAAQLTAEGLQTKRGKPWHKSTVAYVLKTHGR